MVGDGDVLVTRRGKACPPWRTVNQNNAQFDLLPQQWARTFLRACLTSGNAAPLSPLDAAAAVSRGTTNVVGSAQSEHPHVVIL
jgi:hypothetical protein